MMKDNTETKYILPPHLKRIFDQFVFLYDTVFKNQNTKRRPLIIHGAPGVGKSIFTHAFETMFIKDNKRVKEGKRINISAIPETLLESELFGHKKGAFTGASNHKIGLLESAQLVILEEIGELSRPVQAKLLTFIEDGIYYSVGDEKHKNAKDIQIIATTNVDIKSDKFRQDFLDRFYTFCIPAFHERRADVLYMLAYLYPDFFRNLSRSHIMAILAYHWPGNMREIEKFGTMQGSSYCQNDFVGYGKYNNQKIIDQLKKMNIDVRKIEKIFNKACLSFENPFDGSAANKIKPFINLGSLYFQSLTDFPKIEVLNIVKEFSKTEEFFVTFSDLLGMDYDAEVNFLDFDDISRHLDLYYNKGFNNFDFLHHNFEGREFGLILDFYNKSENYWKQWHLKKSLSDTPMHLDPFAVTEDEYLKSYYMELLSRANNNVAEVARLSSMNRNTLDNRLIKLGIHPTRKK